MALETYKGTLVAPNTGTAPVTQVTSPAGLNFVPKVAMFFCSCSATPDATAAGIMHCFGAAVSPTSMFSISNASDDAVTTGNAGRISRINTECIVMPLNGTPAVDALAKLVSFNSVPNGFTLSWTDLSATAGQVVHYFLLGGSDLTNAAIVEVTPSSTTNGATQAIAAGFAPDFVLTASPAVPAPLSSGMVDANLCIGAARRSPTTQQYATFWFENDGVTTRDLAIYSTQSRMGAIPGSTAVKDADFSLSTWDANGITINWNDAPASTSPRVYMLFLKGGQYELSFVNSPTAVGNQSVPVAFRSTGILNLGTTDPTDTDTTASTSTIDSAFTMGACDSALRQGDTAFIQQDASTTSRAKRRYSSAKLTTWLTGTAGTVGAEASVTAISAADYTMAWSTASATVRRMVGISFGSNPVATVDQAAFRIRRVGGSADGALNAAFAP